MNGKYGGIDKNGKIVIPFEYDKIGELHNGLIAASKNNLWGFIDTNGNIKIPFEYEKAHQFKQDDLAEVAKYGKSFLINKQGQCIIENGSKDNCPK